MRARVLTQTHTHTHTRTHKHARTHANTQPCTCCRSTTDRVAPFTYVAAGKKLHVREANGHLLVRTGGGYEELLTALGKLPWGGIGAAAAAAAAAGAAGPASPGQPMASAW